jgi:class 3 adenylate cyclase
MSYREFHYRWVYDLRSSPEKLWPFAADTNRFNRDTGVPALEVESRKSKPLKSGRRFLRLKAFGMPIEWEETPFEWIRPARIGVTREYSKGPVEKLVVLIQLEPKTLGGTKVTYEVWARPKSALGLVAIPLQIGLISARRFARAFREYDEMAQTGELQELAAQRVPSENEQRRLDLLASKLVENEVPRAIANQLVNFVGRASDTELARIRPYALADNWNENRREVLEACFQATRVGLLDLQWDLLCPMCRGPQESSSSLKDIHSNVHCAGCQIDFSVNFDRFVELTFRPNATIRTVDTKMYCMGSPQRTPHVVAQQLLPAKGERTVTIPLELGRYRVRTLAIPGEQSLEAKVNEPLTTTIEADPAGWKKEELLLSTNATLHLINTSDAEQLFVMERTAWSDQAATAAEVTALQIFRDLFSSEALRPGEQISVGTLTVLFTDLRNSTQLYREIGDATAFGRVLNHFDVLKQAIAEEDGAVVKTIGDAVMAVFREPDRALKAMLKAQHLLAFPPENTEPLILKAGLHVGPCIAVTLNDRLDYFGSTVNLAARLEGLSTGNDVIISHQVFEDPEVQQLLQTENGRLTVEHFDMTLKGFKDERFALLRVARRQEASSAV